MKLIRKVQHYYKRAYSMGHYPSLKSVMFTDKKIFVYYGFLGDNNYGDELVYHATKALFEKDILLPVSRYMPILLRLFVSLNKSKISGIAVGGGTLVGRFNMAAFFEDLVISGKSVYMHGTGVKEVIGEQNAWSKVLSRGNFGGVRGPMSVQNIAVIKKEMKIVGDAAFALFSDSTFKDRGDNKKVLINLGTHASYHGQEFFRKEFKEFITFLIGDGYVVNYLPFHEIDLELGNELKKEFAEINILKQPDGFEACAELFADCTFAIGERLHFTVMAVMTKSPFISINYAKKHEDLLLSLDIPEAGLSPDLASLTKIKDAFIKRKDFEWTTVRKLMIDYKDRQFAEMRQFVSKS